MNGNHYTLSYVREDHSRVKDGRLIFTKPNEIEGSTMPSVKVDFSRGEATVLSITESESKLFLQLEMDTCDTHNNEFAMAYLKSVSNIFEVLHQGECDQLKKNASLTKGSSMKGVIDESLANPVV